MTNFDDDYPIDERKLVARALAERGRAEAQLLAYLRPTVQKAGAGVIRKLGRHGTAFDIADVVQDGLLYILETNVLAKWQPDLAPLTAYVWKIASNRARRCVRRSVRWNCQTATLDESFLSLCAGLQRSMERVADVSRTLTGVLSRLTEAERELLTRLYVRGQSFADIAQEQKRSVGAIYQEHHRLRERARASYRHHLLDGGSWL